MAIQEAHYERYEQLRAYIGYSDDDQARMKAISQLLSPYVPSLVDQFYTQILRHDAAAKVITGGQAQVDRLKHSLAQWLKEFLNGDFDEQYLARRVNVGKRHVVIGLDQIYASASLARLRTHLLSALAIEHRGDKMELRDSVATLNRRFDLDMVIIEDAYQQELIARSIPISDARMGQQTAIARLGQRALASSSIADLLDHATITVGEMLHVDYVAMWRHLEDRNLRLVSGTGWPPLEVGSLTIPFDKGAFLATALVSTSPVFVPDFRSERQVPLETSLRQTAVISGVAMQVMGPRGPFGTLAVFSSQVREFTEQDQSFLASVCQLLAMAIRRVDAESVLRDREERLQKMVEHLPAGAAYIRDESMLVNQALEEITGYSRLQLATVTQWRTLTQGPSPAEVRDAVGNRKGGRKVQTFSIKRSDGALRQLEFSGYHEDNEDIWLVYDVTELKEAEERYLRSERLAAIGQMITGLAHESRNALQRIQACTEMLEFELDDDPSSMELLHRSQQAQQELRRLFDEVRDYARPMKLDLCQVELPKVWREAWDLLQSQRAGRKAVLVEHVQAENANVYADRYRLVQFFRNVFENALAASGDPCEVRVDLREIVWDGRKALECLVTDNGPGLTPEVQRRIFEPFFTTKTKGTGLGMAIAERLVDAHGGKLTASNGQAGGAQFCLLLPMETLCPVHFG